CRLPDALGFGCYVGLVATGISRFHYLFALSDFRFPPGLHRPPDRASGSSYSRENRLLSHITVRVRVTIARESPAGFRSLAKASRLGDSLSRKGFPPQPQAT